MVEDAPGERPASFWGRCMHWTAAASPPGLAWGVVGRPASWDPPVGLSGIAASIILHDMIYVV